MGGIRRYYHNKIGSYPKEASAKYSDMAFGQMMILKQVAVALSLESGYDVLFQDIDITWLKDPRPELLEGAKRYEIQVHTTSPWSLVRPLIHEGKTREADDGGVDVSVTRQPSHQQSICPTFIVPR